jgi:hypothetical protein
MTALFPQKNPNIVEKIITLDNRRMTLPKLKRVKVYSLRSSDQPADEGVLPTEKETKKYKMKIVKWQIQLIMKWTTMLMTSNARKSKNIS